MIKIHQYGCGFEFLGVWSVGVACVHSENLEPLCRQTANNSVVLNNGHDMTIKYSKPQEYYSFVVWFGVYAVCLGKFSAICCTIVANTLKSTGL